ncbi:hypothetical protein Psta_1563 [Pirellula staleyi DSM 6068]|uniref:Uncharacterized protein n=1 Tax=Pirellula staleyi (strain ATCC 27377 / DSM 6068 / ICPB 4128) TaxID=530564 RepID=D2QXQ3_PIRSD|nr:hypothetical protein [Pirellula staleyi]ADB16238.1 hypothetical protein Psta_1563 [Pirellula staleyi DSM 6068]
MGSKSRFRLLMIAGGAALVIVLGLAAYSLRLLQLETGHYHSPHGFRIDGAALRAFQEAQQNLPGAYLVVETRRAMVGPELSMNLHVETSIKASDYTVVHTRGVPLAIEHYLTNRGVLGPIITHDGGNDKRRGYRMFYTAYVAN